MAENFHDVSAEVEGRTYTGVWTLKPGGKLCVAWPLTPVRHVHLPAGRSPEAVAMVELKRMVERWLVDQRR